MSRTIQDSATLAIRSERTGDEAGIAQLVGSAFETEKEVELISTLRDSGCFYLSLVAEQLEPGNEHGKPGKIVGHILFTPVQIDDDNSLKLVGLAPLSVLPDKQGKGIGSKLIKEGLRRCRIHNIDVVVVLGNPDYYGQFDFAPASAFGIESVYEVEDKYFMLQELNKSALDRYIFDYS